MSHEAFVTQGDIGNRERRLGERREEDKARKRYFENQAGFDQGTIQRLGTLCEFYENKSWGQLRFTFNSFSTFFSGSGVIFTY